MARRLSVGALAARVRRQPRPFQLTLSALMSLAGTQILFWAFTFPANRATDNWTHLPAEWTTLRTRWEYSHAASAVLNLIAFCALALAIVDRTDTPRAGTALR